MAIPPVQGAHVRVVCRFPGCGYRSRDTYDSSTRDGMEAAEALATRHASQKHPGVPRQSFVPVGDGRRVFARLVTLVSDCAHCGGDACMNGVHNGAVSPCASDCCAKHDHPLPVAPGSDRQWHTQAMNPAPTDSAVQAAYTTARPAVKAWTIHVKTYNDLTEEDALALRAFIQKTLEDAPQPVRRAWRSVCLEA